MNSVLCKKYFDDNKNIFVLKKLFFDLLTLLELADTYLMPQPHYIISNPAAPKYLFNLLSKT